MSGVFDELSHLIALHAQQQAAGTVLPFAIGHVVGYDPNTGMVQCGIPAFPVIDPLTGAATGGYAISPWMQLGSPWVGNGWGFQTAPEVGDATTPWNGTQCAICIVNQGSSASFVANMLYTSQAVPPDPTLVAGEAILKHKSGSYIKFNANGNVTVLATGEVSLTAEAVPISADASVSGGLTVGGGASGTFTTPTGLTVTVQDGIITNIF